MRSIFTLFLLFFSNPSFADVETPDCALKCTADQRCVNNFTSFGKINPATCENTPSEPQIDFVLPFDKGTVAICTHSSGSGSHSGFNAYYALDLAVEYDLPAPTVRAAADGTAYVFIGDDGNLCPEPKGTPASADGSDCGNGWGNHILILHDNGYASFYVHLDHPLVENGKVVHQGDTIGVMGWTGQAGHRHTHWSIQKIPGTSTIEWIQNIAKHWTGDSVPFRFSASRNGIRQNFHTAEIRCVHANVGSAPPDQQPRFIGL